MHINRPTIVIIFIALFAPTILLVLNQLVFTSNDNDMMWDYLGAIGWAVFMSCLILLVYNKSNNIKYTPMNKWTKKVSASFLNRHYSNANEVIIPMKGGIPVRVAPKGMFLVGLFTDYDELAFIDLRPKHISITLSESDQIATTDGVKIHGTVEITTKVFEDDKFLIRLISNEEDEEKILNSHLKKSIRKIISDKDWIDITIFKEDKYLNIKQTILKDMKETDCCFNVDEVMFINLAPIDSEFANLLEQKRKQKEQAKFQEEQEIAQQQKIKIVQQTENIQLKHEREKEKENTLHSIDVTKLKSQADIERINNEHAAELSRKIKENDEKLRLTEKVAELLEKYKNSPILADYNLPAFEKLEETKLKALELQLEKEKSSNEVIKQFALKGFDTDIARTKGQVDVFKAVASKTLGIDGKLLLTNEKDDPNYKNQDEEIKQDKKEKPNEQIDKDEE